MWQRWKSFLEKPWVLLAILIFQVIIYWTIAIYKAGEVVPVAYQKF
jgi:hypothetical protein